MQIEILKRADAAGEGHRIVADEHESLHDKHVRQRRLPVRRKADETGNEDLGNALGDIEDQRLEKERPVFFDFLEARTILFHLIRELRAPFFGVFDDFKLMQKGNKPVSAPQHRLVTAHAGDKKRQQKALHDKPRRHEKLYPKPEPRKHVRAYDKRRRADDEDRRRIGDEIEYEGKRGRPGIDSVLDHIVGGRGLAARRRGRDRGIVDIRRGIHHGRKQPVFISQPLADQMDAQALEDDKQQHADKGRGQQPGIAAFDKFSDIGKIQLAVASE